MSSIKSIGFLGPWGSFSEEAANEAVKVLEIVGLNRVSIPGGNFSVISALRDRIVDSIVMAVENSITGIMTDNLRQLNDIGAKSLHAYINIPVIFCLMGLYQKFDPTIQTSVLGHEQAQKQCSKWLKDNPTVSFVICDSNSQAAQKAKLDVSASCLAPELCAEIYGLHIYQKGVQDTADNVTTFGIFIL